MMKHAASDDSNLYTRELLPKMQAIELELLREFDRVCRKHDIPYFLVWGSMLGALRHQGFIPWDDDIDVGMMREDYERLRALPEGEWNPAYELSDPKDNSPQHLRIYPKLHKRNTIFESEFRALHDRVKNNPRNLKTPIWIDVFVLDRVKSPKLCRKIWRKVFLLSKLYYWSKSRVTPNKSDSLPLFILNSIKFCLYYALNVVKDPELKIVRKIEKLCVSEPGEYITDFYADHIGHLSPTKEKDFFPLRPVDFEDIKTWIPKNAEQLMTQRYGNFMQLPPEDQRVNHAPYHLDFGDGLGERIQKKRLDENQANVHSQGE